jgi:Trypsin-like peptidase domain
MNKLLVLIIVICGFCQISNAQTSLGQSPADSVITIFDSDKAIGSGIVVGSDGYILTALHLVKNAGRISIKLNSGEIYDDAKIVQKDERRNIALLQVIAGGLKALSARGTEEPNVGTDISIISNGSGDKNAVSKNAVFNGNLLADNIAGAGTGYRLFLFETKFTDNQIGGLVLDDRNRPIAIVTANPEVKLQNIAVPFSSISGLIPMVKTEAGEAKTVAVTKQTDTKTLNETKQIDVKEPAKKTVPTAAEVLRDAKTVYVKSHTGFIKDSAFIAELMKNTDFAEWGWSFTTDKQNADLIIEVDRLALVIKFTFKVYSIKHGIIIASGNKHTNDFDFGSPDLVREIIKRIKLQKAINR